MENESPLTVERLRELLTYDSNTGAFAWRKPGRGIRADQTVRGVLAIFDAEWNTKTPSTNRCGLKGVYRSSPNRWRAQIKDAGKRVVLGHFDDKESAHAAYRDAAVKLRGEFSAV